MVLFKVFTENKYFSIVLNKKYSSCVIGKLYLNYQNL